MIAFQINGNYLFFLPALQASGALAVGTNQWIVSWTYWLPRAAWLVFPAILLLPSLTVLWQNKRTYDQKQLVAAGQIAFPWTFLGLWIIWLFWELTHHPLLQTQYYMDYLLPFGYLAFGAFLAMRWGEWIERHFHTAAWMLIIAFSGTFALARLLQPIFSSIASYAALIPFVLGTVGMINLAFSWINLRTLVIGILCLSLANVFVYHAATIIQILDEPEITWSTGTPDEYLTIYDAVKAIQKFSPMGNIYFWYNSKDPEPLRHQLLHGGRVT